MTNQPTPSPADERIACALHGEFADWLASTGGSLALTTYQAGKVASIGWDGAQPALLMRDFDKPMGLAISGRRMAIAARHHVHLLADAPPLAYDYQMDRRGAYDGIYFPRVNYFTGDLNIHDLAYDKQGLLAVATRFSCLARLSDRFSFEPVWRPSFVTDLAPEDRCHLNGLALVDGRAKYVTALGTTDAPGAWRENKKDGGVVIDVESNEIVRAGLSMPHSPRWHDGALYVLNSGYGELWRIDPRTGEQVVVRRLPGYLRGMDCFGPYAVIAMSKIRERHIFGGLPIQELEKALLCGVAVVDLRSGGLAGVFEFTSGCTELYDVRFVPDVRRPMILNEHKEAVREAITNPESSFWLRPEFEVPSGDASSAKDAEPTNHSSISSTTSQSSDQRAAVSA